MVTKVALEDIQIEKLNYNLPSSVPLFVINDGCLLKKETLLALPYRFLLLSSKRRLDLYTPFAHEAINKKFDPFGGQGKEYIDILEKEIFPLCLEGADLDKVYYGGISLGGLHAIYASTFAAFPIKNYFSICGSFWFPGFVSYLKEHNRKENLSYYLLNGKKEGVHHQDSPLYYAYPLAIEVSDILKEGNIVTFLSDDYPHHDYLTQRFLSLIKERKL